MTDAELRDAAIAELKQTTVGWSKVKSYSPEKLATTHWGKAMNLLGQIAPAPPPPPPTGNPYTDMKFASGAYRPDGISIVMEAYQSDNRLSNEGFQDAVYYDSSGMTLDPNQRVHLFHPTSVGLPANPNGSSWASWHGLRASDGPWGLANGREVLAKASIESHNDGQNDNYPVGQEATWGGLGAFVDGVVRWMAWDILFPLNINDGTGTLVSFQFVNTWHTIFDLHASYGVDGDPCLGDINTGANMGHSGHPRFLSFTQSPDTRANVGVPYISVPMLQLTNGDGTRRTASYNVWHEVVVGAKYSKSSTGWYELWCDGVRVAPQTQRVMCNPAEAGPYMQAQNYTAWPLSFIALTGEARADRGAIVYGGFRAGLTRADVQRR